VKILIKKYLLAANALTKPLFLDEHLEGSNLGN